jgi:ornithine--oxo-acid transaminase
MDTKQYIALENEYGARNYHPLDVVIQRGEGIWVEDVEGNRYLDCLSAYSALNQGHVHPRILKALKDQAEKVTLTSRAFRNDQLPLLYKELSEWTGYEMSLPMNSGAEAVEMGLSKERHSPLPGRDHCCFRKFPWPHYQYYFIFHGNSLPR